MRAARLICAKDLRSRLRDRSAVLIGVVVPLGLAFIFNSIFSGISGASDVISLGVVNADHGAVSQQFTSQVPSGIYLALAIGSIGLSATLYARGKKDDANFVGHWAPTLLLVGLYNKLVKLHGSD